MTSAASKMDAAQFERVAAECKRWSGRSLSVAKALILENASLSEVAAAHSMSPQQANVIRSRFFDKAENLRVQEFMRKEKPRLASATLEPFSTQMQTLRDKGYTIEQIVAFLKENGVKTSQTTVRTFLRDTRA